MQQTKENETKKNMYKAKKKKNNCSKNLKLKVRDMF